MKLQAVGSTVKTQIMDHHGIVASVCKDLKIAERINSRIGSKDPRRVIQPGTALVAMIINALGFTNRRLYLTPQFYQSKAVEHLLGEDVKAEDLDDHCLGKCLDEISSYGVTKLYGETVFDLAIEHNLLGKYAHLDSTSFVLQGEYAQNADMTMEPVPEGAEVIEVVHGYSKDHRPDLKQVMLSLSVSGEANIPIWMEPLSGNSSDKSSFHETITNVRLFQKQLNLKHDFIWIADSALYTADKLLGHNNMLWVSRVPENIKDCVGLLELEDNIFSWEAGTDGYRCAEVCSNYGTIKQRWIIVSSEQAYDREKKTFERQIEKQLAQAEKDCWHLSNEIFNCEKDALSKVKEIQKKYKYLNLLPVVTAVEKHAKRGRPDENSVKELKGYQINITLSKNDEMINRHLRKKGRFIIATNNLDYSLSALTILNEYKDQQCVESGFKFLKDPWFMMDSFYVKKPGRIAALMMVMTLSLLVYNFAQYKLRQALLETNETIPNQVGKPIQNPTIKWVFQIMEGIGIIKVYDNSENIISAVVTNIDELRLKILKLIGGSISEMYGI